MTVLEVAALGIATPAEMPPRWRDDDGNLYRPHSFNWELP